MTYLIIQIWLSGVSFVLNQVSNINHENINVRKVVRGQNDKTIINKVPDLANSKDSFEKTKVDSSSDNKFTFKEAAKNFFKGMISPLTAIVKHPIASVATVAICGLACTAVPVLTPLMTLGFGALSVFQLGKGIFNSIKEYKNGNYDNAEKSFQDIGAGTVGVATSVVGLKQSAKIAQEAKIMNKANTNFLSPDQKAQVAENISKNSFFGNLKEIISLITTKDGRRAFFNQFKPSSIKAKLTKQTIKTYEKREISKKEEIENFKKSQEGIRRANLSDEQIQKEIQASFDKAFDEMGIPKEQRPKLQIIDEKETLGGNYSSAENTLRINKNSYKAGVFEIDNVCAHEATHHREALLRARLSQEKVNQVVKDELVSKIINGESEEIIKSGSIFGVETMKPPQMSTSMRVDFSEFAKRELYNNNKFKADDLTSELTALIDKHPDFISQFASKDEALKILKDYSISHHVRFNCFTQQGALKDIASKLPALTPEEEVMAIQSLKDNIPTLEGNARNSTIVNSIFGNQKAYNQYQFSPEEVLAEQNGNKHLISQLHKEMQRLKSNGCLNAQQEKIILDKIQRAQATIDFKTKGLEYYKKYEQLLNNPADGKLAQEVAQLKTELQKLEDATKMYEQIEKINYTNLNVILPVSVIGLLSQLSE